MSSHLFSFRKILKTGRRRKVVRVIIFRYFVDESSMVNPRVPTQYYYALRLREQMTKRAAAH
jgi:hypothetical protein